METNEQNQKELRRYGREQILEEGILQVGEEKQSVDILDVSVDAPDGIVRGFGILASTRLSQKQECLLHLPTTGYSGHYLCAAVYCQDTGFGYRAGLMVRKIM